MIRVPAPFLQKGVKRGSFLTWYPFPAPFLGKGVKRKGGPRHKFSNKNVEKEGRATTQVFLRKTLYLFKNTIFVRKTKSLYLFNKWLTKKNLFETKNGFFFLSPLHFLFVSWPSLQIPFLLGKPSKIFYKVKVVRT